MSLFRLNKSQKGLSLVEVTIAGAIMVGISLVFMRLNQIGQKSVQKVKTDYEFENLKMWMRSSLGDPKHCHATFDGFNMKTDNAPATKQVGGAIPAPRPISEPIDQIMDEPTVTNVATNPRFYEIGNAATLGYPTTAATFDIKRLNPNFPPAPEFLTHVTLEADNQIPGFSNWKLHRARFYQLFGNGNSTTGGLCSVYFEVQREIGENSKRSFGAPIKAFWVPLHCSFADAAAPNEVTSCRLLGFETDSYWQPQNSADITEGIIFPYDVYVGKHLIVESDERYKKDFQKIENASEKLSEISGFYYFMRADEFPEKQYSNQKQMGLIAQEVEKYFPEAVVTSPHDGFKAVRYSMMVPVLIQAHKEQEQKLRAQEKQIRELQDKVEQIILRQK